MRHEDAKTAIKAAFEEAANEQQIKQIIASYYKCLGMSQPNFERHMERLVRIAVRDVELGMGQLTIADNGLEGVARPNPIAAGQGQYADGGHARIAGSNQDLEGQNARANGHSPRALQTQNEQGQHDGAEGPDAYCPAQPSNGAGHAAIAINGQSPNARTVTSREPTQSQINGRLIAKSSGARTLFDQRWLGTKLGDWTYSGLVSVRNDGAFAEALIRIIGDVSEAEAGKTIRQLLGDNEKRLESLRPFMAKVGLLPRAA